MTHRPGVGPLSAGFVSHPSLPWGSLGVAVGDMTRLMGGVGGCLDLPVVGRMAAGRFGGPHPSPGAPVRRSAWSTSAGQVARVPRRDGSGDCPLTPAPLSLCRLALPLGSCCQMMTTWVETHPVGTHVRAPWHFCSANKEGAFSEMCSACGVPDGPPGSPRWVGSGQVTGPLLNHVQPRVRWGPLNS